MGWQSFKTWFVLGPLQALGMVAIGYSCMAASSALFSAVPGSPEAWWRLAPGWGLLVWFGKRSAAAGWWRLEGAMWQCVLLFAYALAVGGNIVQAASLGYVVSSLWVCLWAAARWRLERDSGWK